MWPQFEQINRPLERIVIGWNFPTTMQYGQRSSFFCFIVEGARLPSPGLGALPFPGPWAVNGTAQTFREAASQS